MKINEIKPKSKDKNKSSKQSLRTDAEYVSDDDDGKVYSDADEYLDAEEEDIENETFWQRIQALADIFPEHKRAEYSEKIQNYGVSAWKAAKFTGNIAWILTTSAMVLAVPLMFEIEREQSMLQWEKEQQQLQKQGAQQVNAHPQITQPIINMRPLGVFLLLLVVFIWVAASYLMRNVFIDQQFQKPFFVTFLNTSSFAIFLLFHFLDKRGKSTQHGQSSTDSAEITPILIDMQGIPIETANSSAATNRMQAPMTVRETTLLALQFCVLWFLANYSTNASLALSNVATTTILSSTSSLWTLLICGFMGMETFGIVKLLAVLLSIIGVSVISYFTPTSAKSPENHDFIDSSNQLRGSMLALFGAICYGSYVTLLRHRLNQRYDQNTILLFFGLVGMLNSLLLIPLFPLLDWLRFERFEWPPTKRIWYLLASNSLIGTCLSEYLWLWSLLLTSPLIATMGLSLTIPLSLLGDIKWAQLSLGVPYFVGALCVFAGFMAVNLAEIYPTKCAEIESALLCATQSESITQPDQNNAETTVIF